jgi:hypothetical protein
VVIVFYIITDKSNTWLFRSKLIGLFDFDMHIVIKKIDKPLSPEIVSKLQSTLILSKSNRPMSLLLNSQVFDLSVIM